MSRRERNQTDPGGNHLERLADDENGAFGIDVGELSGIARKEQEGKNEDGTDDRQLAPGARRRNEMHSEHRHDNLEQIVVERPKELRPQERLQPTPPQRFAIVMCHIRSPAGIRASVQDTR